MTQSSKQTIGSAESVEFGDIENCLVKARIDTGAKTSSISALTSLGSDGELEVVFLIDSSRKKYIFNEYSTAVVASSNGISQRRYVIKTPVRLAGRVIRARFTLADRSTQAYPVLIGRNVLQNKFIVDVSKGEPDMEAELKQTVRLRKNLVERNI